MHNVFRQRYSLPYTAVEIRAEKVRYDGANYFCCSIMYFPIGAPSVYSQDLPAVPRDATHVSDDGLNGIRDEEDHDLMTGREEELTGDTFNGASNPRQPSPLKELTSVDAVQPNQHDTPKGQAGLMGMQSARSGQIFATITTDSITVWQSRVRNRSLHCEARLTTVA